MKKVIPIIGLIGLLALAGGIWYARIHAANEELKMLGDDPRDRESTAQRIDRFRTDASGLVAKECTNEVPGIKNIVHMEIFDSDDNYTKWTADVTLDFYNHIGGVDRTNLSFGFSSAVGDLTCYEK